MSLMLKMARVKHGHLFLSASILFDSVQLKNVQTKSFYLTASIHLFIYRSKLVRLMQSIQMLW